MAEPKAQTLLQKMGFKDFDLTTPKHDEIMLWLDTNMDSILYSFDWLRDIAKKYFEVYRNFILGDYPGIEDLLPEFPENVPYKIKTKQWECPITGYNSFIVGFIDLRVATILPNIQYSSQKNKAWLHSSNEGPTINFEVKSTIPSLGELYRQINMYKQYLPSDEHLGYPKNIFVVVSPDDRYRSQIESQGIHFLKPETC